MRSNNSRSRRASQQMRRMTIWVDKSSGLVLYTEAGNIGGDVFVYGNAVKDPTPLNGKK